jgi:hypothetical protein
MGNKQQPRDLPCSGAAVDNMYRLVTNDKHLLWPWPAAGIIFQFQLSDIPAYYYEIQVYLRPVAHIRQRDYVHVRRQQTSQGIGTASTSLT